MTNLLNAQIWSQTYADQDSIYRQAQIDVLTESIEDIVGLPLGAAVDIWGTPLQVGINDVVGYVDLGANVARIWLNVRRL